MQLDFGTGTFVGQPAQSRRTLGELRAIFANPEAVKGDETALVYEVHGCAAEVDGPPRLLYATTLLYPGQVGREYFMTRGHFHEKADRGELMFTLSGVGGLVLMSREGETWMEPMSPGSVHDIDGRHAHRVANTGSDPLIFLVTWMSDCGHDYETIRSRGFSRILVCGADGPELIDAKGWACRD